MTIADFFPGDKVKLDVYVGPNLEVGDVLGFQKPSPRIYVSDYLHSLILVKIRKGESLDFLRELSLSHTAECDPAFQGISIGYSKVWDGSIISVFDLRFSPPNITL